MRALALLAGAIVTVLAGVALGAALGRYGIPHAALAALIALTGMLGRSGTAWALRRINEAIERKKGK